MPKKIELIVNEPWAKNHNMAVYNSPMGKAIAAWGDYATIYQRRYKSSISNDPIIGQYWLQWGQSLRGLLNGELSGMDAGTCENFLVDTFHKNGFKDADFE